MLNLLKQTRGYLRIRVSGFSPERFMNLCSNRDVLLWDIVRDGDGYIMCVSLQSFYQLKAIVRKTRTKVVIIERCGLPFLVPVMQKRRVFMAGLILTVSGVIILSFKKGILSENVLSFFSLNVAFMSMGIFAFFESIKLRELSFIKRIAPLTGGIYGLHLLILPSIYEKISFLQYDFLKSIISSVVTFLLCGAMVIVFKFGKAIIFKKK